MTTPESATPAQTQPSTRSHAELIERALAAETPTLTAVVADHLSTAAPSGDPAAWLSALGRALSPLEDEALARHLDALPNLAAGLGQTDALTQATHHALKWRTPLAELISPVRELARALRGALQRPHPTVSQRAWSLAAAHVNPLELGRALLGRLERGEGGKWARLDYPPAKNDKAPLVWRVPIGEQEHTDLLLFERIAEYGGVEAIPVLNEIGARAKSAIRADIDYAIDAIKARLTGAVTGGLALAEDAPTQGALSLSQNQESAEGALTLERDRPSG